MAQSKLEAGAAFINAFAGALDSSRVQSSHMRPTPAQWGLRGDPFLWDAMSRFLGPCSLPKTEDQFLGIVEMMFEKLTGKALPDDHAISEHDSIFVKRYAHGGMSSGHVSLSFWRSSALPLLRSRFNVIRNAAQNTD